MGILLRFLWLQWAISVPSLKVLQVEILPKFYEIEEPNFTHDCRFPQDLEVSAGGLQYTNHHLQAEQVTLYNGMLSFLGIMSFIFITTIV